jgi:hypothetical protein
MAIDRPVPPSRLMDQLLELVGVPNHPSDTLLRRTACQCLVELEHAYPGLLAGKVGLLLTLAQRESTHVFQVAASPSRHAELFRAHV